VGLDDARQKKKNSDDVNRRKEERQSLGKRTSLAVEHMKVIKGGGGLPVKVGAKELQGSHGH